MKPEISDLAKEILKSVYVAEAPKKIRAVCEILESDIANKATAICDRLKIERRGNRQAVINAIDKSTLNDTIK